jgi:hypothetical protein
MHEWRNCINASVDVALRRRRRILHGFVIADGAVCRAHVARVVFAATAKTLRRLFPSFSCIVEAKRTEHKTGVLNLQVLVQHVVQVEFLLLSSTAV